MQEPVLTETVEAWVKLPFTEKKKVFRASECKRLGVNWQTRIVEVMQEDNTVDIYSGLYYSKERIVEKPVVETPPSGILVPRK